MFVAKKNQEIEYAQRRMDVLIPKVSNKHCISIKSEPLTFLLGLIDTIEPIKRFQCCDPICFLKDFDIDVSNSDIKIEVPEYLNLAKFFKGIDELENWMNVKILSKDLYKRTIRIL